MLIIISRKSERISNLLSFICRGGKTFPVMNDRKINMETRVNIYCNLFYYKFEN